VVLVDLVLVEITMHQESQDNVMEIELLVAPQCLVGVVSVDLIHPLQHQQLTEALVYLGVVAQAD
jgi:hypothetical protein